MKVAIIGSGISGLTAAYYLSSCADITLFEKASRLGGHTATVDVELDGRQYAVDTGFIVYNEHTYPNFIRLLSALNVPVKPTTMGFSVSATARDFEYSGAGFKGLFAQKSNIVRLSHWRMIVDILRFNRYAYKELQSGTISETTTLGQYLQARHYSQAFIDHYLVPMGAAIWSSGTQAMLDFPVCFFIRFFHNHGLLKIINRPQWYVIQGGSRNYIPAMLAAIDIDVRLQQCIESVTHNNGKVEIRVNGKLEVFDEVIFACHSDEALLLIGDKTSDEVAVLGAMPYQNNEVVLHTDDNMLPKRKQAWSSWNYCLQDYRQATATLTYNMNILQGIKAPVTFCVSLNATKQIDKEKILASFDYAHPVFTLDGMKAQQQWPLINGVKGRWYCGAYWRNGFHEDGVVSALRVVNGLLKKMHKPLIEVLQYE